MISLTALLGIAGNYAREIELTYPDYFPEPAYDLSQNQLTTEKIELGRRLFYDEILSADNTVSCASCHSPYNAFAHSDHDLSHGIEDQIGTRNAPPLFNLAWSTSFHRDGAIHHLDVQPLAPISHPAEMGSNIQDVVVRLAQREDYRRQFALAFKDGNITGENVLKALAQFQLTLVSANAKYDRVQRGVDTFSAQELKGYQLFQQHCDNCHAEPLFTNHQFANHGLELDTTLNDYGRMLITGNAEDSLDFKVASLRNSSYTSPYMHDGRFKTLKEVIGHYAQIADLDITPNEQKEHSTGHFYPLPAGEGWGEAKKMKLSSRMQKDLIAFLLTLDDRQFVFNPSHGFPKE